MQEALIETDGVRYAEQRGWLVYKWASPGRKGILDRLFFKSGVTFAIEYKTTGKVASPQQRKEAQKLKRANIPARCCDNIKDSRAFIDRMTEAAESEDPTFDMLVLSSDVESFGEED